MLCIAIANPEKIPGGLQTVYAAVKTLIPDEGGFSIIECRRHGRAPRSIPLSGFNERYAFAHAIHAFDTCTEALVAIGFSCGKERISFPWGKKQGNTKLISEVACFVAVGETGSASEENCCEAKKDFSPEEAQEMLTNVLLGMCVPEES